MSTRKHSEALCLLRKKMLLYGLLCCKLLLPTLSNIALIAYVNGATKLQHYNDDGRSDYKFDAVAPVGIVLITRWDRATWL